MFIYHTVKKIVHRDEQEHDFFFSHNKHIELVEGDESFFRCSTNLMIEEERKSKAE